MTVGTRHRPAPAQGRAAFALMSVIALLALACFPVLAQAESSSGVQYSDSIPSAEGEHAQSHKQEAPAKASKAPHGGTNAPDNSDGEGTDGSGSEGESSAKGSGAGGAGNGGGPQGSQGASPKNGAKHSSPGTRQVAGAEPASESSGGGSSPLVPILIAIAVLAAISVAVVMIRQRRQRSGPAGTPSPEAN